ncbi:uncharacterized protein LOC126746131 isoform X4 [Anthonomus grandis grandis]|uniref:uncharacterized protein LOC126746131 isoform X4 n=1 Tax=Anthonomus grandis grandis TaxID=2921223 RepID=UPI002165DF8C|nr:uncharacterized protein LOC126746131 isoform X4 [Anthonomus grandis grandis]
MVVLRRKSDNKGANGLYVHSNPPRILSVSAAHIKQLIRNGDIDKLEQVVYEGQGKKLVGEYSADYKTRTFIRSVPSLMSKISLLHDAVNSDKLSELQTILDEEPEKKKKLAMAKDECGVGLLHKAVYYDLKSIYRWLIDKFPQTVNMRDSEGRTPIFYSLTCKDPAAVQKLLTVAGADPHVQDVRQHTVKYYANHLQELELPSGVKSLTTSRKSTATGESLNFKKSNIRIWIHQRNLANLQQVVWEGHGPKLLVEHSNNPKIRKFLDAVPCIMGLIKDVHCDVQNDDLENLKNRVSSPVPIAVLTAKDSNGLTPLHKAVGLGREDIAKFIIETVPNSVTAVDNERRTPLHYSALLKDDNKMFNYLIEHGADESALDHRQKTAAYYKMRTSELDPKLLQVVPDCPRCSKEPNNFDWSMLTSAATSLPLNGVKKAAEKIQNGTKELVDPPQEPMKKEEEEEEVKQNGTSHEEDKDEMEKAPTEEDPGNIIEGDVDEETEPENTDSPEDAPKEETEEPNNNNEEEINEPEEEKHEENGEGEEEGKEDEEETPPEATKVEEESHEDDKEPIERPPSEADTIENKAENNEENKREEEEEEEEKEEEEETKIEEQKEDKKDKEHTQTVEPEIEGEAVIEGVVDGQHEVETMNNDGQNPDDVTDPESVKSMIRSGNMEQLAALVLNGDGDKLIGEKSDNPELQTFLNNVPVYMSKIHKIHVSAREGNLRDLQAALDRRKFAVARDVVSPNGATPLHVAIVFVRTSIVRYLAGRFPETVHMEDDNGRTPLHYAAVLKDNGHYYNLLLHLGADSRVKDKFGHTPEFYLKNQSDFNHRQILTEFHAEEMLDDILNDKEGNGEETEENGQVDMPFFATEEGRYLASSLGDPLIKGLTEVANKRPEDPIAYLATYLYNFARSRNGDKEQEGQHGGTTVAGGPQHSLDSQSVPPATIDVVTVEPNDNGSVDDESAFNNTSRDEHGQSMLHFAAARAHGRNALFQLLLESEVNVAFRDELYRTARDISIQANIPENTAEIDRYVLHIATKGDTSKLVELLLEGYDHITDIVDADDQTIIDVVAKEGQSETVSFLQSILAFEEKRERVHHAIRQGSITDLMTLMADENDTGSGKLLAIGKNSYGRCSLHIAVLCQQEEIVDYLANTFSDTLRIGDNLERTALHYAMGVEKMETISKVLIKSGAKRVVKDLKGRQPTYYFLNKSDILRLQEEEETF